MKSSISPYKLLYNESKVKFWHKRKVWDKFYYAIILYYICYFCSVLVSNNRTDQQWSPRDLRAMFYFSCVSTRKKNDLMMMSQTLSCFLLFTFIWYVLTRLNNTKSRLKNDFTGEILILNWKWDREAQWLLVCLQIFFMKMAEICDVKGVACSDKPTKNYHPSLRELQLHSEL